MNDFEMAKHGGSRGTMKRKHQVSVTIRKSARVFLFAVLVGELFLSGCSGGGTNATSVATPTGTVNTYQGVSNVVPAATAQGYIPFWTFVLDGTEGNFNYNNPLSADDSQIPPITGTYSSDNGYLALTTEQSQNSIASVGQFVSAGYALAIPGELAMFSPASNTTAPIIAAGMSSCPVATNAETVLIVAMPGAYWSATSSAAYGSLQVNSDATGTAWIFAHQSQSPLVGAASLPSYPASFSGTCGQGVAGYSISVLATVAAPYNNPTISISPNGFFTETATGLNLNPTIGGDYAQQPFVGVVAPSSALNTTSLAAGKYLGFEYESLPGTVNSVPVTTQLVSFGSVVVGSGTTITGGVFLNDDPSQTAASNITVNFGSQSTSQNGLYPTVTVTIPDTSTIAGTCAKNGGTPGKTASGGLLCSFTAVAIAGNPLNKFAIFLIGQDPTQSNAPFGLYLYQQ